MYNVFEELIDELPISFHPHKCSTFQLIEPKTEHDKYQITILIKIKSEINYEN